MKLRIKECGVMDSRFKNIDKELHFAPNKAIIDEVFQQFDDLALDNAFLNACQQTKFTYAPSYWTLFKNEEADLIQNVNFSEAAQNSTVAYHPFYWNEAESALIEEGLHYQYDPTYWSEAKQLLHKADKKVFFRKWLSIASLLLIFGFLGNVFSPTKQLPSTEPIVAVKEVNLRDVNDNRTQKTNDATNIGHDNFNKIYKPDELNKQKNTRIALSDNTNSSTANKTKSESTSSHNSSVELAHTDKQPEIGTGPSPLSDQLEGLMNESDKVNSSSGINTVIKSSALNSNHPDLAIKKIDLTPKQNGIENKPKMIPGPEWRLIEVSAPIVKNRPEVYALLQSGIGNTFSDQTVYNYRLGADLGIQFNIKQLGGLNISVQSGFDYQSLENFVNSHSVVDYKRTGSVNYLAYGYEFADVVKFQNTVLVGYQVFPKFGFKIGGSIDQYFTSKIKVHERVGDIAAVSPYQWGKNDFIRNTDFQIVGQIAYDLFTKFSIIASADFGLINQINHMKNPSLEPIKNRSLSFGIKYRLN
jgi:hypothetical protein